MFNVPPALLSWLETVVDVDKVLGVAYSPELRHYRVSTDWTFCEFVGRQHRSKNQYFIINETGEVSRGCHYGGEDCHGKQIPCETLPGTVMEELKALAFKDLPLDDHPLTEEIIESAYEDASCIMTELSRTASTKVVVQERSDHWFEGDLQLWMSLKAICQECNQNVRGLTGPQGTVLQCPCGAFRDPPSGTYPVDDGRFPHLSKYWSLTLRDLDAKSAQDAGIAPQVTAGAELDDPERVRRFIAESLQRGGDGVKCMEVLDRFKSWRIRKGFTPFRMGRTSYLQEFDQHLNQVSNLVSISARVPDGNGGWVWSSWSGWSFK